MSEKSESHKRVKESKSKRKQSKAKEKEERVKVFYEVKKSKRKRSMCFSLLPRAVMSRGTRWVESNYGPNFCEASVFKGLRAQCLCGFADSPFPKPAWLLHLRGMKFAEPVFMRVCSQSR